MGLRGFAGFGILLAAMALVAHAEPRQDTVERVIDGDTFATATGERVRLLDINTPEIAHENYGSPAQPGGAEATRFLQNLVGGKAIRLETGAKQRDTYDRLLAQAYLTDGTWVNGELVRAGMAHVYTFADNAMFPDKLLPLEAEARANKRGIWAQPRWQVRDAATCCADADIGLFILVQGKVLNTASVDERVYFNFGKDWRTDFSFFIAKKDVRWFKKAGIAKPAEFYKNKTVRVRGFLQPVNGVMVRVTHPAQIEVVE